MSPATASPTMSPTLTWLLIAVVDAACTPANGKISGRFSASTVTLQAYLRAATSTLKAVVQQQEELEQWATSCLVDICLK